MVERLLDNLLENALRYAQSGGRVDVSVTDVEDCLRLEVADTGGGIAEEDASFVFDRFYRAHKSRNAASGGAGLGLAIAKRIVELHRGQIAVRSEVGAGARFIVDFPFKTEKPP